MFVESGLDLKKSPEGLHLCAGWTQRSNIRLGGGFLYATALAPFFVDCCNEGTCLVCTNEGLLAKVILYEYRETSRVSS